MDYRRIAFHGSVALLLLLIVTTITGCSGINASKSFSPLDFFLPGLMQNRPPSPVIPAETNTVRLLAQADHVPRSEQCISRGPRS
jgi:hypothetical protein